MTPVKAQKLTDKPGHKAMLAEGCTCDPETNRDGAGYMSLPGKYLIDLDCPHHGGHPEPPNTLLVEIP